MADEATTQIYTWGNKDPDEVKKYWHDWTAALNAGEVITSVNALIEPDDVSSIVIDSGNVFSGNTQEVKLSAGADGKTAKLTLRATIDGGDQIYDVGIRLKIKKR